jgi:uncharacterized membrane protein
MGKHRHNRQDRREKREQFTVQSRPAARTGGISWNAALGAVLVVLAILMVVVVRTRTTGPAAVAAAGAGGGDVLLPVADFSDGVAKFYRYTTLSGRELRFFVMKSSDGVVRAAFDTCDVCYRERRGYRQEGDAMVCNNCGQQFPSRDINVLRGGCNPAPIERAVEGNTVVLRASALEAGAWYF